MTNKKTVLRALAVAIDETAQFKEELELVHKVIMNVRGDLPQHKIVSGCEHLDDAMFDLVDSCLSLRDAFPRYSVGCWLSQLEPQEQEKEND